jgi:transposase
MAKKARRNYDDNFKTKVVIEALKEQKTLAQLSSEFEIHATQITDWKKQVITGIPSLFGAKKNPIDDDEKEEITAPLYQQIGQLKVELDYFKKKFRKNI